MWHADVTVLPLLDRTKAYLQAIIDNYSRRILAWRLGQKLEPAATAALLVKASSANPVLVGAVEAGKAKAREERLTALTAMSAESSVSLEHPSVHKKGTVCHIRETR